MPAKPSLPANLSRSYWKKNKVADSKSKIGDQLDKLTKAFNSIKWDQLIVTDKNFDDLVKSFKTSRDSQLGPVFHYITKIEDAFAKEDGGAAGKEILRCLAVLSKDLVKFSDEAKKEINARMGKTAKPYVFKWAFDFSKYVAENRSVKTGARYNLEAGCVFDFSFTLLDVGGKENAYVNAFIADAASKTAQKAAREVMDILDRSCKEYEKTPKEKQAVYDEKYQRELQPKITKILDELKKSIDGVAEARWNEYVKGREEYKKYKLQSVKKVGKAVVGVAGSTAGLATSAAAVATGGGAFAGIFGLLVSARNFAASIAKLTDLAYKLGQSADEYGKKVNRQIKKMHAEFERDAKTAAWNDLLKQTGGALQQQIFDFPFIATSKTAAEDCAMWEKKTQGVMVAAGNYGRNITKLLQMMDEIGVKVKNIKTDHVDTKKRKELEKSMEKMEGTLGKLVEKTSNLGGSYEKNIKKVKKCLVMLDNIAKAREDLPLIAKLVPASVTLVGSLIGAFWEPVENLKEAASLVADIGGALAEFAKEVKEEI
jgi:hypothetical protein